jgi:ATP-dependent DNA ligase
VVERGSEGLLAKDPASPYRGGRTLAWLKVKVPHCR